MSLSLKSNQSQGKKRPRLIIVSAPSGAGKTTLCERLIQNDPTVRLSISTTTRTRRPYEIEGTHYHFVSNEAFDQKIANGDFAEWAHVHNNRYGTSKKTIEDFLAQGKNILFDIDIQGALNLKKQYADRSLLIFIHPPSMEILKERLVGRDSEDRQSLATRLENAREEVSHSKEFDYEIVNDHLERAYAELIAIVEKECR